MRLKTLLGSGYFRYFSKVIGDLELSSFLVVNYTFGENMINCEDNLSTCTSMGLLFFINCERLRRVCPIRRLMEVWCFFVVLAGKKIGWTDFLIFFSLVDISFLSIWPRSTMTSLMTFFMSLKEKIGKVRVCTIFSLLLCYDVGVLNFPDIVRGVYWFLKLLKVERESLNIVILL